MLIEFVISYFKMDILENEHLFNFRDIPILNRTRSLKPFAFCGRWRPIPLKSLKVRQLHPIEVSTLSRSSLPELKH